MHAFRRTDKGGAFKIFKNIARMHSTQKEGHPSWSAAKIKYRDIPSPNILRDEAPPSLHDRQSRMYA